MTQIRLARLPLSWKILFTGFVLILSCGYLAAAMNAKLAVGMSPQKIAGHYGNKALNSAEKAAIAEQGFVEEELSFDEEPEQDAGMASGSMADHTGMQHEGMDHVGHSGMQMKDDSLSPQILAQVSHIHWLGFSLLLICLGGLFCLTTVAEPLKATLVTILCLSFFSDILGLNLTRFVADGFAWLTFTAGTLVGVCIAIMSLRILWELWLNRF